MATFTFKIDLSHDGNSFQSQSEIDSFAKTKSIYVPMIGISNIPVKAFKHNDEFTLDNLSGLRLKKLIESGFVKNIKIVSVVEEEVYAFNLVGAGDQGEGLFTISIGESSAKVGGQSYEFNYDEIGFTRDEVGTILCAANGEGLVYVFIQMQNNDFRLFTIDSNGDTSFISLPEFEAVYSEGSVISGGFSDLDSITCVGTDKLAVLINTQYILFQIENGIGTAIVNRSHNAFSSMYSICYFDGAVYGFGYGNILYLINKDTGAVYGEDSLEDKKSHILSWTENSSYTPDISSIENSFVHNGKLYGHGYNQEFADMILFEVLPDSNEIKYICKFEPEDIYSFADSSLSTYETDELGFATNEFMEYHAYYYNGYVWISRDFYPENPTTENTVLQWAEYSDFDMNGENATWTTISVDGVNPDNRNWELLYNHEGIGVNYTMRMRYVDGEKWVYLRED